ncbi:MAG: hypothetical protein HYW71_00605 [Candidatus Niyogibacteria bacterium]|nr:hypothetical protein [Candidatus Niyogibacteria bacterium]
MKISNGINFLLSFIFLAIGFLLLAIVPAKAINYPVSLSGYAWSDNIGWISFNCANNNSCITSNYKVEIDSAGYFKGYAWSDNIGWIGFEPGDVSGCPSGSCRAIFNPETGDISGWARVISCRYNPDPTACGGWDGWVSLSGSNPDYGVSVDLATGKFEGFAWSDSPVGWINFGASSMGGGVYMKTGAPFVELRANGSIDSINISAGGEATLTWERENVTLESCLKTSVPLDQNWNNLDLASNNSYVVFPNQTVTYTLTCVGGEGEVSDNVVINVVSGEPPPEEELPAVKSFSVIANPSVNITILNEEGETCASDVGNSTSTIMVTPFGGFNENVSLSITDWGGLSNYLYLGGTYADGYNFSRNPLTSSYYESGSVFNVCVKPNAPKGSYLINIKGTSLTKGDRYDNVIVNIIISDPGWQEI